MKKPKEKTIVFGVTGSIATYKAADLASKLTQAGRDVRVLMTRSALEFVTPLTFETLTNNPVIDDMFEGRPPFVPDHIAVADAADLLVIVPATANIIAKIAAGIADDMVTLTVVTTTAPVLIAPAMNDQMYANRIVQRNIQTLKDLGYHFVDPEAGMLACNHVGYGRLAEVPTLMARIDQLLAE